MSFTAGKKEIAGKTAITIHLRLISNDSNSVPFYFYTRTLSNDSLRSILVRCGEQYIFSP